MDKQILVTGGCGFIGANLVPRLVEQGYQVRVLDNLSRGYLSFLKGVDIEFQKGDIRDSNAMKKAVQDIDAVIHLAAYGSVIESLSDAKTNFDINGKGTLTVLDAAKDEGVDKFILASTGGAIIGDAEPPVSENSIPRPKSPYGASKLTCEAYCQAYGNAFGLPTVMLRFANIYGPFSAHKKGAVTVFSKALISGDPITIYGDGNASRDFLHVDDLCNGIIKTLETDLPPATVMHLATGRETSVMELMEILKSISGKKEHPVETFPSRAGEVLRNFANFDRAEKLIDFKPEISLEKGLEKTWQWFLDQGDQIFQIETTDS
jgi:UDP-glucose 4-epimerase